MSGLASKVYLLVTFLITSICSCLSVKTKETGRCCVAFGHVLSGIYGNIETRNVLGRRVGISLK